LRNGKRKTERGSERKRRAERKGERERKREWEGKRIRTPNSLFRQFSLAPFSFSYVREDRQEQKVACVRCGGCRRRSGGGSREDMEHEPTAVPEKRCCACTKKKQDRRLPV